MFEILRADLRRFADPTSTHDEAQRLRPKALLRVLSLQGAWAVTEYRFRQWSRRRFSSPLERVLTYFTFKFIEITTGISISREAQFGPGLYVGHFGGIIVGRGVRVGSDCNLSQGVTLGIDGADENRGSPTVGDRVYLGPGAKVFGSITIGDNVAVGANAVINKDVPPNMIAVGVPARHLPNKEKP